MLKEKLIAKTAYVSVIGLGYVGLPLAIEMANAGYKVLGLDVSEDKIRKLNQGESYVQDVSSHEVEQHIHSGQLIVSTDYKLLGDVDAISICVPTPLNKTKDPDVSYINNAVQEIVNYLKRGTLITLESTTYPGTTEELIQHEIEGRLQYSAGIDFYLCFSPERIDPGNRHFNTKNTPKVIGGTTPACSEHGMLLYGSFIDNIVPVSSTKVAEMVKLLENTFRSVNIALVNELTLMSARMGINVWEVIDAAATKPFGFMPFYPGPGIGGHCIPLDPMYLSWKAKTFDFYNQFIELASDINGNMPRYVITEVMDLLNKKKKAVNGARILMLGMSYKKNVGDIRESPALEIYHLLLEKGAEVTFHDPYIPVFRNNNGMNISSVALSFQTLSDVDLVIITTDHSNIDYAYVVSHANAVLDTRNATKGIYNAKIVLLGGQSPMQACSELMEQ